MNEVAPKAVSDLVRLVKDGEQRVFARTSELDRGESIFYRVTTAGTYQELPRWMNSIPVQDCPRPAVFDWSPVSLPNDYEFQFSIDAERDQLADLYRVTTGLYLLSDTALELLTRCDPSGMETGVAKVTTRGGVSVSDFKVVMPTRVLDAVDISKTDVVIGRNETITGSRKFVTQVDYPNGFFLRGDIDSAVMSFLGKYDAKWWWRADLVRAAVDNGMRGLRAVFPRKSPDRPEIRT